jgi:hypothetical protein
MISGSLILEWNELQLAIQSDLDLNGSNRIRVSAEINIDAVAIQDASSEDQCCYESGKDDPLWRSNEQRKRL